MLGTVFFRSWRWCSGLWILSSDGKLLESFKEKNVISDLTFLKYCFACHVKNLVQGAELQQSKPVAVISVRHGVLDALGWQQGVKRWVYSGCLMKIYQWVKYGYEKKKISLSQNFGLSNKKNKDVFSREGEDYGKSQLESKIMNPVLEILNLRCQIIQ